MEISFKAIGFVRNDLSEPKDYQWGEIVSVIELEDTISEEALEGLAEFSHIEVVYYFHKVKDSEIHWGARHPRENTKWPLVGIFAQRAKARPNKIGVSSCQILSVEGRKIKVKGLDAIDGTPVLDIKAYVRQFEPRGKFFQAAWMNELMADYFE